MNKLFGWKLKYFPAITMFGGICFIKQWEIRRTAAGTQDWILNTSANGSRQREREREGHRKSKSGKGHIVFVCHYIKGTGSRDVIQTFFCC
jgi:hypothetical protein